MSASEWLTAEALVSSFKSPTNAAEPDPVYHKYEPFVWDLVLQDMAERDKIGSERYGTRLQPNNGRNPLIDAYQEALDLVVYLRQAIYEQSGK